MPLIWHWPWRISPGAIGATVPVSADPSRPLAETGAIVPTPPPTRNGGRWGDLGKRVGSAVVLAPLALTCLWFGKDAWTILIAVGALGCAAEWVGMNKAKPWAWPTVLLPVGMAVLPLIDHSFGSPVALALAALLAVIAWVIFGRDTRALWLAGGFVYLAPAVIALVRLRHLPTVGRWDMVYLVLVIWASDIGAYLVGRLVGGPKLAPAISPGKTWSGAIGGTLAAALVGLGVAGLVSNRLPLLHCVVISIIIGIASQIGDLLESGFKRHFGVKDSGRSIPGHGGLLDRLDGMLTAAPTAIVIALLIGEGVWLWQ
ncbi:phosphatidate cytidylyltransferase [Acidisoma cellulosilytica]|uniref:Phosphatidate cytidylyltransferase n=1 Tax=Acidisoma cellulosilyticum TaxID=2802395 RepID=A0A963Z0A1_9PROT|nr:phosphatidate cytidylyltransferase [Acidisoma cellulosilyticum]MCB8880477.1 phosphatidate cytidylyltransferase [Acidisoma cellulosilyticum]